VLTITAQDILRAGIRLGSDILETPLLQSAQLNDITSATCYLKFENRQYTGSFKARGALNKVRRLQEEDYTGRVVTASTGNHAQGMARALEMTGLPGTIYLPAHTTPAKIEALRKYTVDLELYQGDPLQTELYAKRRAAASGDIYVSPYNDPDVVAGQGTIGAEITSALGEIAAVYITVGGGGLISGIATWLAEKSPQTEIIGCLPERSPEMKLSIEAGYIVHLKAPQDTLSDGSAGGCEDGSITFPICQKLVHRYLLVTEEEIASAMRQIYSWHGERIEGAAGVAIAAMKADGKRFAGRRIVGIVCGGNIGEVKFSEIAVE